MHEKTDKMIEYTLNILQRIFIIAVIISLLYFSYNAIFNMLTVKYILLLQNHNFINDHPIILHALIIILALLLVIKNLYKKSKSDIFLDKQDFKIHIVLSKIIISLTIFSLISTIFKIPEYLVETTNIFSDIGFELDYYNIFSLIFSFGACFIYTAFIFIVFFIRFFCLAFMKNFNKLLRVNLLALICAYSCCYIYFVLSLITLFGGGIMN